jgi:hypothetical protein
VFWLQAEVRITGKDNVKYETDEGETRRSEIIP